jgi:hypothetical protein
MHGVYKSVIELVIPVVPLHTNYLSADDRQFNFNTAMFQMPLKSVLHSVRLYEFKFLSTILRGKTTNVTFVVLTKVSIEIVISRHVTPCTLVVGIKDSEKLLSPSVKLHGVIPRNTVTLGKRNICIHKISQK